MAYIWGYVRREEMETVGNGSAVSSQMTESNVSTCAVDPQKVHHAPPSRPTTPVLVRAKPSATPRFQLVGYTRLRHVVCARATICG
jgi:hypothetical protein